MIIFLGVLWIWWSYLSKKRLVRNVDGASEKWQDIWDIPARTKRGQIKREEKESGLAGVDYQTDTGWGYLRGTSVSIHLHLTLLCRRLRLRQVVMTPTTRAGAISKRNRYFLDKNVLSGLILGPPVKRGQMKMLWIRVDRIGKGWALWIPRIHLRMIFLRSDKSNSLLLPLSFAEFFLMRTHEQRDARVPTTWLVNQSGTQQPPSLPH